MNDSISPAELKSLQAHGCCLVDVREPVEHAEEHITGAKLIPLGEIGKRAVEIDRTQPVVIMCRGGKRGEQALVKLRAMGFTEVRNLAGGILAWKAAGLPVDKAARNVFPLMRQVQIVIGLGVLLGVILARTVHPDFIFLSAFFGAGLLCAGLTGWCGLVMLMSRMPWNQVPGQTDGTVRSCSTGC